MGEFVTANGRLLHYALRQGAGRPVVFANSLGTDLRIWDEVIAHLPGEWPTLAYDKSGHGLSEAGAKTITDHAMDLAALMDVLALKDALVCGVSVGGMIAQALASARPDLVAGLVLCNTGHRIGTSQSWSERITTLDAGGLEPMADGIIERWFSPRFRQAEHAKTAGYRLMLARTPLAGYRAVCAAIRDADLTETTRKLTCTTLCVAGSNDLATPSDVVHSLADLITGARYCCYAGVGHLPCIEAPADLAKDLTCHMDHLT